MVYEVGVAEVEGAVEMADWRRKSDRLMWMWVGKDGANAALSLGLPARIELVQVRTDAHRQNRRTRFFHKATMTISSTRRSAIVRTSLSLHLLNVTHDSNY